MRAGAMLDARRYLAFPIVVGESPGRGQRPSLEVWQTKRGGKPEGRGPIACRLSTPFKLQDGCSPPERRHQKPILKTEFNCGGGSQG